MRSSSGIVPGPYGAYYMSTGVLECQCRCVQDQVKIIMMSPFVVSVTWTCLGFTLKTFREVQVAKYIPLIGRRVVLALYP